MIWELSVNDQIITMLVSAAVGGALCIIYDIMRGIRRGGALTGFWQVLCCDILFWILSAVVVFCLMLVKTSGVVRSYLVVGLMVGFLIVRLLISRFILKSIAFLSRKMLFCLSFLSEKYRKALLFLIKYMKNAEKHIKSRLKSKKTLERKSEGGV